MKQTNAQLIIVPDIHGRTFWKEIFDYDCEVVFLGDYLDPFRSENIYPWDSLQNFTEIIAYAKANPKVHLLIGNHDLSYIKGRYFRTNRCDLENYDTIHKLFCDNESLFQLTYDCTINGKKFFLSHAGILFGWYERHRDIFSYSYPETLNATYINELYRTRKLDKFLQEISGMRLGTDPYGSIVWADIREWEKRPDAPDSGVIQIVGHTQIVNGPLNLEKELQVYDVDSRKCVYIDPEGTLRMLSNDEII